ncbi:MAG TPA: CmpA/NrtA family ABC transporter substrate-binding protein [Stellaceae bacterium]|nr:CmpA/NrtA family ABC transporter substrate-binding protein [Stellaceae bacterium]
MTAGAPFRIGLLRLTDAAPLIVAAERGYFAAEGLEVQLSVEPSWANISDKLSYGLLDGAMMLPPLALALRLGLSGGAGPERVVVPAALSLNGNTVTLAERWIAAITANDPRSLGKLGPIETGRRFAAALRGAHAKPHLAVVHTFSTHNLLLRYWLATAGLDPEREVSFAVVPPAETCTALAEGRIDGFCAGAPWGEMAARAGLGQTAATSHAIWNNGTEKVFAVREALAEQSPARLQAALRAVLRGAIYCDRPANAPEVAEILAREEYLGLPAEVLMTSLPGAASRHPAGAVANADISVFFGNAASYPWRSHAQWFLQQMARWGYIDDGVDIVATAAMFRPDLYAEAARSLELPVPITAVKREGEHAGSWLLPAAPCPIEMRPDRFLDGAMFDPV